MPSVVRARVVMTLEYGLRPAARSALSAASAFFCAAVFGVGAEERGKMKHPCALTSNAQAAKKYRITLGVWSCGLKGAETRYDGLDVSTKPSIAIPMVWYPLST